MAHIEDNKKITITDSRLYAMKCCLYSHAANEGPGHSRMYNLFKTGNFSHSEHVLL